MTISPILIFEFDFFERENTNKILNTSYYPFQRFYKKMLPSKHWIESPNVRKAFWARMDSDGLSNDDVHAALGVDHVKDFDGTMDEALKRINHWVETEALLDEEVMNR